jgi:hypothetical protein
MLALFDEACVFENISGKSPTHRRQGGAGNARAKIRRGLCIEEQKVLSVTEEAGRLVAEIDYRRSPKRQT